MSSVTSHCATAILDAAEKAYGKVLERHRGTSLKQVDDYANLSRVLIEKGHAEGARQIIQELKRDWRGNRQGEYAAAVMDSLCLQAEGEPEKAKKATEQALALYENLAAESNPARPVSQKITIDLAHACLATGATEQAQTIMRKVAAENNDNPWSSRTSKGLFADGGMPTAAEPCSTRSDGRSSRSTTAASWPPAAGTPKGRYVC